MLSSPLLSGTDLGICSVLPYAYGHTRHVSPYALCGTDLGYAATRRRRSSSLHRSAIGLRARYPMSGTDLAYGATSASYSLLRLVRKLRYQPTRSLRAARIGYGGISGCWVLAEGMGGTDGGMGYGMRGAK
eukprot:428038-Rhodomonas_salina.1